MWTFKAGPGQGARHLPDRPDNLGLGILTMAVWVIRVTLAVSWSLPVYNQLWTRRRAGDGDAHDAIGRQINQQMANARSLG